MTNKMNIKLTLTDNTLTIAPIGRLDSTTSDELQEAISQHFTPNVAKLVFNLSEVDFISSKGLRVIVATYKSLNGRAMEIVNPNDSVKELFHLTGLANFFGIE